MRRNHGHQSYTIDVQVETRAICVPATGSHPEFRGYIAIVETRKNGQSVATFSPLRLGDITAGPFASEADAITGAYGAARKIIDGLSLADD